MIPSTRPSNTEAQIAGCPEFTGKWLFGLNLFALVFLILSTLPGYLHPFDAGALDQNWVYALNFLANSSYVFGRDIVYTYGPLGYLLVPICYGHNLEASTIILLSLHLIWAIVLCTYLNADRQNWRFACFCIGYALLHSCGLAEEYQLPVIVLSLCYLPFRLGRPSVLCGLMSGALSAVMLLMKFTAGAAALSFLSLTCLASWWKWGNTAVRQQAWAFGSFMLCLLILAKSYFHNAESFSAWIAGSLQISSGYSTSMSLVDAGPIPSLGIIMLVVCCLTTIFLCLKGKQTGWLSVIGIVGIFIAFKHSFVRQDTHELNFFLFLCATLLLIAITCSSKKEANKCLLACAIVYSISIYPIAAVGAPAVLPVLSGRQGLRRLSNLFNWQRTKQILMAKTQESYHKMLLPDELTNLVHHSGNPPVATIPNCTGYCPANKLIWRPLPVVQLYSAYTPYLDRQTASFFSNKSAPEFVIYGSTNDLTFDMGEIDHKNPALEAPLTWLSLMTNFDTIQSYAKPDNLLLARRKMPRKVSTQTLSEAICIANEWAAVPNSDAPLLAQIYLKEKPLTPIITKLYQLAPVFIEMKSTDSLRTYRVNPENLAAGLILSCAPRNTYELGELINWRKHNQVQAFRLVGPGLRSFRRSFRIKWQRLLGDNATHA